MTQKADILAHLKRNKRSGITSYAAATKYGVVCLHKRIEELEGDGHFIVRQPFTRTNRHGNTVRVYRYLLR